MNKYSSGHGRPDHHGDVSGSGGVAARIQLSMKIPKLRNIPSGNDRADIMLNMVFIMMLNGRHRAYNVF